MGTDGVVARALAVLFLLLPAGTATAQDVTPVTPAEFTALLPAGEEDVLDAKAFRDLRARGDVAVLDVRSAESYRRRHIKGAINIPLTELTADSLAARLPDRTVPVVLVCDNSFAPTRSIALTLQAWPVLRQAGYGDIHRLTLWREGREEADYADYVDFEGADTPSPPPPRDESGAPVFCAMDAKMCPDGSYVSRTGPDCAFAPCPGG